VVDGNCKTGAENNAKGNGIAWIATGNTLSTSEASNGITVANVWIRFCAEAGYFSENATNGIVNVLENVSSYWNKGNGFTIHSSDGMYTNSYSEKNGLAGWEVGTHSGYSHFANCGGSDSGQVTAVSGYGWLISSSYGNYTGCYAQDNTSHGVYLNGSVVGNSFTGCNSESNGYGNASFKSSGFYINNAKYTTIVGCMAMDRREGAEAGNRTQAWGYTIAGTAEGTYIDSSGYNNVEGLYNNVASGPGNVTSPVPIPGNTGFIGCNLADRAIATVQTAVLNGAGLLQLCRVQVQPGGVISKVHVASGSTEGTLLTHTWAAIYSTTWQKQAVSKDITTTPWPKTTERVFELEEKYTVPAGVTAIYVGIVVAKESSGVMPTFIGAPEVQVVMKEAEPWVSVYGSGSLTTPSTAPTETIRSAAGKMILVWLT